MVSTRIKKPPLSSLPYMKKRLRRITALGLRNLTVDEFNFTIYFTLHRNEKTVAFYTSEIIENQRSPEWSYLNFPLSVQSIQDFLMRIWVTTCNSTRLFLEYDVHLDDSLMPEDQNIENTFTENDSLWIEMFGYRFSDNENQLTVPIVNLKSNLSEKKSKSQRPDKSYERSSLERIIAVVNDIHETNQLSTDYLNRLQALFDINDNYFSKIKERESRLVRIANLKQLIYTQTSIYERYADSNKIRQKSLNERRYRYEENLLLLLSQQEQLKSFERNLRQSQYFLNDLTKLISFRRIDLIVEIYRYIYPIVRKSKNTYLIANVRLPAIDEKGYTSSLVREHENEIIAAVTFCAHFVLLLSKILHLPLRYPLEFCSSSSIKIYEYSPMTYEYTLSPISGNSSFYYGYYLLNKNIGQIFMHCCHMKIEPDCRKTLENLKIIMDHFLQRRNSIQQLITSSQQTVEMNSQTNSRASSVSYDDQTIERNLLKSPIFSSTISEHASLIEPDNENSLNDDPCLTEHIPRSNSISPRLVVLQHSQQNYSIN